jgi:hypothetical protein
MLHGDDDDDDEADEPSHPRNVGMIYDKSKKKEPL